jgi:hypothetical protein
MFALEWSPSDSRTICDSTDDRRPFPNVPMAGLEHKNGRAYIVIGWQAFDD